MDVVVVGDLPSVRAIQAKISHTSSKTVEECNAMALRKVLAILKVLTVNKTNMVLFEVAATSPSLVELQQPTSWEDCAYQALPGKCAKVL